MLSQLLNKLHLQGGQLNDSVLGLISEKVLNIEEFSSMNLYSLENRVVFTKIASLQRKRNFIKGNK